MVAEADLSGDAYCIKFADYNIIIHSKKKLVWEPGDCTAFACTHMIRLPQPYSGLTGSRQLNFAIFGV